MYHMTSGTVSVNVHNAHAASACTICCMNMMRAKYIHTCPHLFEICFKMPKQNCTRPSLPSLSCMDTYGQPDSLDFVIGILCPPGLNYNRNCPIGWLCAEVVYTWKQHLGNTFLRAYIREKSHLKRVAVLFVLVGGFQFDKVVCTWSLSSFFNTLYERYHES